jgi:hypothetical protein
MEGFGVNVSDRSNNVADSFGLFKKLGSLAEAIAALVTATADNTRFLREMAR